MSLGIIAEFLKNGPVLLKRLG